MQVPLTLVANILLRINFIYGLTVGEIISKLLIYHFFQQFSGIFSLEPLELPLIQKKTGNLGM
jgi:hypothetical protein